MPRGTEPPATRTTLPQAKPGQWCLIEFIIWIFLIIKRLKSIFEFNDWKIQMCYWFRDRFFLSIYLSSVFFSSSSPWARHRVGCASTNFQIINFFSKLITMNIGSGIKSTYEVLTRTHSKEIDLGQCCRKWSIPYSSLRGEHRGRGMIHEGNLSPKNLRIEMAINQPLGISSLPSKTRSLISWRNLFTFLTINLCNRFSFEGRLPELRSSNRWRAQKTKGHSRTKAKKK